MVLLRKKKSDEKRMIYEYGRNDSEFIGTIAFDVNVPNGTDISERNTELNYYEGYSFCRLTTSALQGIAKFIRENNFPDNYLRATH